MRGWSVPLGRWLGVEMRVHTFFLLLALVCLGLGISESPLHPFIRGFALFFILRYGITRERWRQTRAALDARKVTASS